MKIWIVVADERDSLFYDAGGADGPFRLVLKITNPQAAPDGELETERPGVVAFISSTVRPHGSEGERGPRNSEHDDFAKRIADEIDRARHAGSFDRFVLGAASPMLGLIRGALSVPSRAVLAAEVAKDLMRLDERALAEHLLPEPLPKPTPRPRAD